MDNQDKNYELTEKGKVLAEELAKKNIEKDKAQNKIQGSVVGEKQLSSSELKKQLDIVNKNIATIERLEKEKKDEWVKKQSNTQNPEPGEEDSSEHKYSKAKKIRGKSFASLLTDKLVGGGEIGESLKSTISEKTKAKMTGIKETFDPMNIAKFMTGGSKLGAAIMGKVTGRDQKDMEYFAGDGKTRSAKHGESATKIQNLEQDNSMVDMLTKIYTFMMDTSNNHKKDKEKENNKKEEIQLEKERRHKELLKALSDLRGGKGKSTSSPDDAGGPGILGALSDFLAPAAGALGLAGVGKKVLGMFGKGIGVTAAKTAKTATKMSKILNGAKGVLRFLNKIPGLSAIAAGATLILDVKNAIDDHEAGGISENEMKKKITEALGSALGGIGGAQIGGMLGVAAGTVVPVVGNLVGGAVGATAGFLLGAYGGKKAAGYLFDAFENMDSNSLDQKLNNLNGVTATPEAPPTSSPASAAPTSPAGATSPSEGSSASPTSPAGVPAPSPMSSPKASVSEPASNSGQKLNSVQGQNFDAKLNALKDNSVRAVTNNSVNSSSQSFGIKGPFPSVRNMEETFQRMILNSTRVV